MSQETIDIMNKDRDNQFELSPSSEKFQIIGGSTFWGVFDRANFSENKDSGNVKQKFLRPVIQVSVVPSGMTERTTQIKRENGATYKLFRVATDDEGIPLLWLF